LPKGSEKSKNDIRQALAVWEMVINMGNKEKLKELVASLPKGWLKLLKQALAQENALNLLLF